MPVRKDHGRQTDRDCPTRCGDWRPICGSWESTFSFSRGPNRSRRRFITVRIIASTSSTSSKERLSPSPARMDANSVASTKPATSLAVKTVGYADLNRTLDGVDDPDATMLDAQPVPVVTGGVDLGRLGQPSARVVSRASYDCTKLIQTIEAAGGVLTLKGDRIRYELPEDAASMVIDCRRYRDRCWTYFENVSGGRADSPPDLYAVALEKTTGEPPPMPGVMLADGHQPAVPVATGKTGRSSDDLRDSSKQACCVPSRNG